MGEMWVIMFWVILSIDESIYPESKIEFIELHCGLELPFYLNKSGFWNHCFSLRTNIEGRQKLSILDLILDSELTFCYTENIGCV